MDTWGAVNGIDVGRVGSISDVTESEFLVSNGEANAFQVKEHPHRGYSLGVENKTM